MTVRMFYFIYDGSMHENVHGNMHHLLSLCCNVHDGKQREITRMRIRTCLKNIYVVVYINVHDVYLNTCTEIKYSNTCAFYNYVSNEQVLPYMEKYIQRIKTEYSTIL